MALQVCAKPFAAPRAGNRRAVTVLAHSKHAEQAPSARAVSASLLAAATLALNVFPALAPSDLLPVAHADEEVSDELLTPYQRRQRELERRRDMLRQTREQAEAKAGGEAAVPSTAEADAAVEAANAERRAAASQLASELKSSAAAQYESTAGTSRYRGFGGFTSAPAPPPAAEPEPAPKQSFFSAPRAEPKPEPVVEAKKAAPPPAPAKKVEPAQQAPAGKQKRRGPLPLFVAEVLVLGGFAGVVLATTKYSDQTTKALALAGAKGKELLQAAEVAIAKGQKQ